MSDFSNERQMDVLCQSDTKETELKTSEHDSYCENVEEGIKKADGDLQENMGELCQEGRIETTYPASEAGIEVINGEVGEECDTDLLYQRDWDGSLSYEHKEREFDNQDTKEDIDTEEGDEKIDHQNGDAEIVGPHEDQDTESPAEEENVDRQEGDGEMDIQDTEEEGPTENLEGVWDGGLDRQEAEGGTENELYENAVGIGGHISSGGDADVFSEPQCLIYTDPDGKLAINTSCMDQIKSIDGRLTVVSITGLYRTGKSYLMNRLAGVQTGGFSIASTIRSHTKGIWILVLKHPRHDGSHLILLDTEGLGDAEKGDQTHDSWIFCLAILLSSTLVYNAKGTIDEDALHKLNFISELASMLMSDEKKGNKRQMPDFVFVLRDFTLDLEIGGEELTPDEYLNRCLKSDNKPSDLAKESIKRMFPHRKCFTFEQPAGRRKLKNLDTIPDSELSPDFLHESNEFCSYIIESSTPMRTIDGHLVNGHIFSVLTRIYVDAIRNGDIPRVDNTMTIVAELECTKAAELALQQYQKQMLELELPTQDNNTFTAGHTKAEQEAMKMYFKKAFGEKCASQQKILQTKICEVKEKFMRENEKKSQLLCEDVLSSASSNMKSKIDSGLYMKTGGYMQFEQDFSFVRDEYLQRVQPSTTSKMIWSRFENIMQKERQQILVMQQKLNAEELKRKDLEFKAERAKERYEKEKEHRKADRRRHEEETERRAREEERVRKLEHQLLQMQMNYAQECQKREEVQRKNDRRAKEREMEEKERRDREEKERRDKEGLLTKLGRKMGFYKDKASV